jgi:hypothetical protein
VPDEIFRVDSYRLARVKRVQNAQHVIGALLLISDGWSHLGAHLVLPLCEIAAGATLVLSIVVEKIRHGRGAHSRVGWVEIAGAAMLYVEAINRLFEPHTIALRILSFVSATIVLTFGLFDVRLQHLPQLRASDEVFMMRLRLILRKRVKWSDVKSVRADADSIYVERNDGRIVRFKLRDVKNRDAALEWAMEQFRRRGLA